ncbi:hypothetical protein [Hymenobacter armeniacus]|uniref:DUF2723 domain-containing protein n=1 Tax=Hymenobacter armeniacus TaxID=2771358 RepID=A0ABR8JNX6_9BACT|nr:hypothetical protein [Hymenobacter armeniacus]MBD2721695.1 hypothetical protein [Hymenobacter armeniacus]
MKTFTQSLFAVAPGALARRLYLVPVVGIGVFAALYVLAAQRYPGGSPADPAAPGFSWLHNYWCNLLNERALNGAPNAARAVALAAMGVLCLSLGLFWWQLPAWLLFGPRGAALVRGTGTLALLTAGFLATAYHDVATTIASVLGLVTLLATFWGLHQRRARFLLGWGAACAVLIAANNVIYYTGYALWFLPLLQKITTVGVLGWIVWMALALHP